METETPSSSPPLSPSPAHLLSVPIIAYPAFSTPFKHNEVTCQFVVNKKKREHTKRNDSSSLLKVMLIKYNERTVEIYVYSKYIISTDYILVTKMLCYIIHMERPGWTIGLREWQ